MSTDEEKEKTHGHGKKKGENKDAKGITDS